ncbi:DUF3710 domain-containing protein [Gardnerella vaginalis]|uniref:DUF3710 domain-containing protein n=1 Tax=Gardnerella vaginalis TaxID=2702 RepID=UPI0039F10EAD
MGWFKSKRKAKADSKNAGNLADLQSQNSALNELIEGGYSADTYLGRGNLRGPWDIADEKVPDLSTYIDFGSIRILYLQGIELRVKKQRESNQVLGITVTYKSSSVEVEAFAAPKTEGIWSEVRADLLKGNADAREVNGVFGKEIILPVKVEDKTVDTRIVGVDGPRWMLRGVFSGVAAGDSSVAGDSKKASDEAVLLNKWFSDIVVDRGSEPLAPRDMIPMHDVSVPRDSGDGDSDNVDSNNGDSGEIPGRPKGPLGADQQVEVKTTLTRGPMFSEVR